MISRHDDASWLGCSGISGSVSFAARAQVRGGAIAAALQPRIALSLCSTWDRMTFNLPFSKLGIVMGEATHVPRQAGTQELEIYRQRVRGAKRHHGKSLCARWNGHDATPLNKGIVP
jgi:lysophospholipid acyltransferase (LPLAT)-like uncharacterized protein